MPLKHNFIRECYISHGINDAEFRLLTIAASFSGESHFSRTDYAKKMGCSIGKIAKVLSGLKSKGLIEIRHSTYKSLHISILTEALHLGQSSTGVDIQSSTKCAAKDHPSRLKRPLGGTSNIELIRGNKEKRKVPLFKEEERNEKITGIDPKSQEMMYALIGKHKLKGF